MSTILEQIENKIQHALNTEALEPIETKINLLNDHGIPFLVYIHCAVDRKARVRTAHDFNPFLPPDQNLFIDKWAPKYNIILNKFPVQRGHILLCTEDFELQSDPLNQDDISAVWRLLQTLGSQYLAFYNYGDASGRSQRHKHMQLIPVPFSGLENESVDIPIDAVLQRYDIYNKCFQIDEYNFAHCVIRLTCASESGEWIYEKYKEMVQHIVERVNLPHEKLSFNWLLTSRWMLIVPRTKEDHIGISVNSVGFAGSILVRNQQCLDAIQEHGGPLSILQQLGYPKL